MKRAWTIGGWALAAVLGVGYPRPGRGGPPGAPGEPELAALVPRLEGWSPTEAVRSFFPDDLFEYINGAAESYLSYDFRELAVADFGRTGTDATLTLEIYDMGEAVNAFGIFGAERYPDNAAVPVGDLGYFEGEAMNFLAGRFYVKMLAFGLGDGTEPFLRQVGLKIASGIKSGGGLPRLVTAFPRTASSPAARDISRGTSWATSSSATATWRPTRPATGRSKASSSKGAPRRTPRR